MKSVYPLRSLALVFAVMVCGAVSALAQAQGKLEIVNGDTYNWGRVAPGELKATIEVKNTGTGDLKIASVQPSCGCTAAPIDRNLLKPGEVGKISVTLNANNRSGELTKTLTVTSDDPTAPQKVIYLKADVHPVMTFEPVNYFLLNNATAGTEILSSITITNTSDAKFILFPPEFVQGNIKVRFDMKKKKTLKPGDKFEVKAHITPLAGGPINALIRMKSSAKDTPQIDMNVWGNANGDASATSQTPVSTTPPNNH